MMILRSVTRWPGRAAVTVFGVSASVAVLVAAFSIFDAMDGLMDELFTHSNRQTVTLSLTDPRPDIAVTEALNLPGVRLAEGALALPVRLVHGASTRLTVLQARGRDASLTRLLDDDGRRIDLPAAGLVLPERLADALGVAPGDRIDIELLAPPRETWTVPVAAVVRQTIGQDAIMDRDAVARLMRQAPRVNQLDLLLDTAAIPALHARVKETPAIGGLALWSEVRAQFEATIRENIVAMTVIHSLLGALIAIGVVYNAARIQLSERAHELATLRVLGFSRGEVGFVLVGELMLLTALAVPVGWIAGWGFAALLVQGFSTDVVSLPLAVSRRTYAFATLVVVAAALGSALAVRRRLDRIDMVSALKAKV
jgi:putative ABC transport system permease protein